MTLTNVNFNFQSLRFYLNLVSATLPSKPSHGRASPCTHTTAALASPWQWCFENISTPAMHQRYFSRPPLFLKANPKKKKKLELVRKFWYHIYGNFFVLSSCFLWEDHYFISFIALKILLFFTWNFSLPCYRLVITVVSVWVLSVICYLFSLIFLFVYWNPLGLILF